MSLLPSQLTPVPPQHQGDSDEKVPHQSGSAASRSRPGTNRRRRRNCHQGDRPVAQGQAVRERRRPDPRQLRPLDQAGQRRVPQANHHP